MPATRQRPVPTYDHMIKQKKRIEVRDFIPLDPNIAAKFQTAQHDVETAELLAGDDTSRIETAKQALDKVRKEFEANSVEVIFRGLGKKKYEKLRREHPPTDEQITEYKRLYGQPPEFNPDEFAPALIAACCVQPAMTVQQVLDLDEVYDWNAAEINHLFQLALQANTSRQAVNWGN